MCMCICRLWTEQLHSQTCAPFMVFNIMHKHTYAHFKCKYTDT